MKCVVSDFDRTLYVDEQISTRNQEAVKRWQQAGNWFVIATGRNEESIHQMLEEYQIQPDAWILNNGALILNKDGKELFCKTIEQDIVEEILMYLYHLDNNGSGVSMRHSKVNVLSQILTTTQKIGSGNLTIDEIGQLSEVLQIHHRNKDKMAIIELCIELNKNFPAISAYANVWNADIVANGVDKSVAIDWLVRYYGEFEEIRVIGDSANDIRMIQDYQGATLKSAHSSVQAVAAWIVEDVAEYLE